MTRKTEDILDGIVIAAATGTILRIWFSPFWWTGKALFSMALCLLLVLASLIRIVARAFRQHGRKVHNRKQAISISTVNAVDDDSKEPVVLRWKTNPDGTLTAEVSRRGRTLSGLIRIDSNGTIWHCLVSNEAKTLFEADAPTMEDARQTVMAAMERHLDSI